MIRKGKSGRKRPLGETTMGVVLDTVGKWIASYLQKELPGYEPYAIAKYVFDGLENVAAAMAEEAEDAHAVS